MSIQGTLAVILGGACHMHDGPEEPFTGDVDLLLCDQCAKDPFLVRAIREKGARGRCALCAAERQFVAKPAAIANVFKAVVRFHYAEFAYNHHVGGDDLSLLLRRENPILNVAGIDRAEAEQEFEYDVLIDALTADGYGSDKNSGVYIYWGHSEHGRDFYCESLRDAHSKVVDRLEKNLTSANYYEFESEWIDLLKPWSDQISASLPAGIEFFRARIGTKGEAIRLDAAADDCKPQHIFRPYVGEELGAPPHMLAARGRLNRTNISFLYLADTPETALAEVRPHPGHAVSVGRFVNSRALRVADLSIVDLLRFSERDSDLDVFITFRNIEKRLANPVPPDDTAGYLLTQFLADTIRRLGFDGVRYRSSVASGTNLAAFSPSSFFYVQGSAEVRVVTSVAYNVEVRIAEERPSTSPSVQYWPHR